MVSLTDKANPIDVNRDYCTAEEELLSELIELIDFTPEQQHTIEKHALELAIAMQESARSDHGLSSLLHKFSLSSNEGQALMHLAEALLRIPDTPTAQAFLAEKISEGDWEGHIKHEDPLLVKAVLKSLAMSKKLAGYEVGRELPCETITRMDAGVEPTGTYLRRVSQGSSRPATLASATIQLTTNQITLPIVRQAINHLATHFVMGKTLAAARRRARKYEARGYRYSYDMLGESARTQADAERYYQRYLDAIDVLKKQSAGDHPTTRAGISVKLSALHPRYHHLKHQRIVDELVPRLRQLARAAAYANINLTVDAENAHFLDVSLDCFARVYRDEALNGWDGFGLAVQAYQKRAPEVIRWLVNLVQGQGRRIMVRLVKGAYWDTEIKYAQMNGHDDYPVYTSKAETDIAFLACARLMLHHPREIYPQFATHNAHTVAAIIAMADDKPFEFQRLHGMGEALFDSLIDRFPCRVYAPVGFYPDLLAYLVRRLLENGANTSFVNHIARSDNLAPLVSDPVAVFHETQASQSPLPAPRAIYGDTRINSRGLNLAHPRQKEMLLAALAEHRPSPKKRSDAADSDNRVRVMQVNPANRSHRLGVVMHDDEQRIEQALLLTYDGSTSWAAMPVAERAAMLHRLADLLETHRPELIALCVYEAGKTLEDSIAEVREAVDFCRYYSGEAHRLQGDPLGVVLCISPWNFPLAIFIGQVAASLVAGNCVIAKAAEQTGLLARRATELIYQAGVPYAAMQLLVCPGPVAGEILVPDARVAAVVFTGSTDTAQWLNRTLANRSDAPVPLIAETGGQNAMLVDSTALPEQVVDDVLTSAFYSAGQRCSALRVLCVQEDIAESITAMLIGAMEQLQVGDPAQPDTDIGPVIDKRAWQRLQEHVDYLDGSDGAELLYRCEVAGDIEHGNFFAPRLYRIDDLDVLRGEVFGPILHLLRYRRGEEGQLLEKIHRTGYGLTFGIHSRRARWAEELASRARAGNVYINRNIVGAVVGVQPFGGIGLSGTGPKAGGPWYLRSLQRREFSDELPRDAQPLPGPTGESNRLFYRPRGAILCLPREAAEQWLPALTLMLNAGNAVTLALPDSETNEWRRLLKQACGENIQRVTWLRYTQQGLDVAWARWAIDPEFVAVCTSRENARRSWLCRLLATRNGPLCPLLLMETLSAERVLWEQTLTVNTTAVGGNAELLGG